MFAALVTGTVVATRKQGKLMGRKLLIVRKLDLEGNATADELVAVDTVGAGVGERVLVVKEGGSASMAMGVDKPPANVVIVGIIDDVYLLDDDFAEEEWTKDATSSSVFDFLKDPEEDIYTLDDGRPIDESK